MKYVVCMVAVSPVRKEAAHKSEMISQLLFGEFGEVLEVAKDFTRVKCLYDGYEGWVQTSQLVEIDQTIVQETIYYTAAWANSVLINGQEMSISFASPVYAQSSKEKIFFGKYEVNYGSCSAWKATTGFTQEKLKGFASQYLNTSYLWGGRSVFGIDCSGFSQQVFKLFNYKLPRDAYQQAELGELIGFLEEAQCGDLAFFDNEEGRITHVGILLSKDEIIHASGKVRIDAIDHLGIVNSDTGQRTHKLRLIKRYF